MFKKFTNGCVRVVNRWLPDPFLFAIILSIVVYVAAMLGTQQGPVAMIKAWGNTSGFWNCLLYTSDSRSSRQAALKKPCPHLLYSGVCGHRPKNAVKGARKIKKKDSTFVVAFFLSCPNTIDAWPDVYKRQP